MADKDNNDIAQITFFLSKEKRTFDTVLDPEEKITARPLVKVHNFTVEETDCRFIYFERISTSQNPPWLDFVNEQLADGDKIAFYTAGKSANGILLVAVADRVLVATFGRSAPSCLDRRGLEPDFGIRTAMNMCGNEEIRQTKTQSMSLTVTHIDRQVSTPSDSFTFGLSEAEDLRYISAHIKGASNMTLQGRDSLTLKVSGKDKLNWVKLITQCKTYLERYQSNEFVGQFPNYRNFRPADEGEIDSLNEILITTLRAKDFAKMRLSIPEFMADDEFSFSYTNSATRENSIHSHLDISQLSEYLDLDAIDVVKLASKKIFAYSHADNRILENKRWPIYECIIFEAEHNGKYFLLNDGRWVQVDDEFHENIVKFVKNVLREEDAEAIYAGIVISDDVARKNKESIFNEKVVELRPSSVLFDRAKLKIGTGKKDKEFCDVLDMQDDGLVRIINVKQFKDAASINYLFSQAKFYCDAFLRDDVFLKEIRGHIGASNCAEKQTYLDYIKEKIEDVSGQNYRLCLWLLYDQRDKRPAKENIPLIAQYELKLMHDHLRRICKFNDIVLRFIPVMTKRYKTALPKKAA